MTFLDPRGLEPAIARAASAVVARIGESAAVSDGIHELVFPGLWIQFYRGVGGGTFSLRTSLPLGAELASYSLANALYGGEPEAPDPAEVGRHLAHGMAYTADVIIALLSEAARASGIPDEAAVDAFRTAMARSVHGS